MFLPGSENPTEINVANPTSDFTNELDLGELLIDDLNRYTSIDTIMVDEEFTTASPENLVPGLTWDAGFDTDTNLAETRALEAMSLQFKNLRTIMQKFEGRYYPHESVQYEIDGEDVTFFLNGWTYDYMRDEYEVLSIEVAQAQAQLNGVSIRQIPVQEEIPDTSGEGKKWESANFVQANTVYILHNL